MKYKVKKVQFNSKDCLVCGLENPYGLKTVFYETEDNQLIAVFNVLNGHQSYPNRLHGGVTAAVLDETIGRAISINNPDMVWGVTMELKVQYRKPIPLDQTLYAIGRITMVRRNVFKGEGEVILQDGTRAATAEGLYMQLKLDQIADNDFIDNAWGLLPDNTVEEIEIPDEPEFIPNEA